MIRYVHGDLIKSDCDVIAHGCNCFGVWGAGIARQLKKSHREAFESDFFTKRGDRDKLGTFTYTDYTHLKIYNLYSQYRFGNDKMHVDYVALKDSLIEMREHLKTIGSYNKKIGFPKIGCGLAGGDWETVSQIIEEVFGNKDVFVYIFEKNEVSTAMESGKRFNQALTISWQNKS
jgi:O-acetyl-ADP-ribose deacetylase (regulator of RNase III)